MKIELVIEVENSTVKIAPLICMAFVENAFKYTTRDNRVNTVQIVLKQKGDKIHFTCTNTYEAVEQQSKGIGLANVMRRLELLYKDRYQLLVDKENNIYRVDLTLTI